MRVTASELRQNIYRILDRILQTGIPVEIERRGKKLKIIPVDAPSKLDNLAERPQFLKCDPEEIIHLDWWAEWRP